LGRDAQTDEPVALRDIYRTRHVSVIGKTGYGKTTLLEHLILSDLHSYTSAILIDPHGDLSQRIISLATDEERERITLLEEWPDRPFRLNLLECTDPARIDRTVDDILATFLRLFDQGSTQTGHRLHRYLGNALRTLIPNNRPLIDVQRLFYDDQFRDEMLKGVTNRKVHEFWLMYSQMAHRERIEQLESTINRLDEFLSSETASAMVDSQVTTVPLDTVLATDGQLLLVRIPVGELGEQQARFYGSLFLSLLTDRLFARANISESARHRLHMYLDEYGWFATSTTAALLQQARKYNLGATIAYQTLADLPDERNKQAALQIGTLFVLQLIGQNADELAAEFPVVPRTTTIMENVGTRSVKGPSQEPVEHLLRAGHSNKEALKAAQAFLRPLLEAAKKEEESERRQAHFPLRRMGRRDDVRGAIQLIDQLLINVMERGQHAIAELFAAAATEAFTLLGFYYGFPPRPLGHAITDPYELLLDSPAFKEAFYNFLKQVATAEDQSRFLADARESHFPWAIPKVELIRALLPGAHYAGRTSSDVLDEAAERLETDVMHLLTLCRVLAVEPILVATGQEEEDMRPRHVVQTHQDARVELAGVLANLRPHTAYYQTPDSHHHDPQAPESHLIALAAPLSPGTIDEEAIEQVRKRSKELYGVQLDDQAPSLGLTTQAPTPRIGRRSPRHDT
jgi:hypothetical protein